MNPAYRELLVSAYQASLKPALTVNARHKSAYNQYITEDCLQRYTNEPMLVDMSGESVDQMDAISQYNLNRLKLQARLLIDNSPLEAGILVKLIREAKNFCKIENLTLSHDYQYPSRDAIIEPKETLLSIRRSKSLQAPYYLADSECGKDQSIVYMQPRLKHDPRLEEDHFLIEQIPPNLFPRSCAILNLDGEELCMVGGNHFEAGWLLSTVAMVLGRGKLTATEPESLPAAINTEIIGAAHTALSDIRIPREVDLSGHYYVSNGVKEQIEPARAAKKEAPVKKELKASRHNPDLQRHAMQHSREC